MIKKILSSNKALLLIYVGFGLGIITLLHLGGMFDQYDDKCGYRVASFLSTYENDQFTSDLKKTLDEGGIGNSASRQTTYQNFIISNTVLQWFEKLPEKSAFQSVVIGHLFIHCIMLLFFFALLVFIFKNNSVKIIPLFLLGAAANGFVAGWLFPFDNDFFTNSCWTSVAPRGAGIFAFIGAVACFALAKSFKSKVSVILGIACLILGFFHHISSGLLFTLVIMCSFVIFFALQINTIKKVFEKLSLKKFLVLVNSSIVAIFILKEIALIAYLNLSAGFSIQGAIANKGIVVQMGVSTILGLLYLIVINLVIMYWYKYQKSDKYLITNTFNALLLIFIPLSVITCGLYFLAPISYEYSNPKVFMFFEGTRRLAGLVHGVFWLIVGVIIVERTKNVSLKNFHKVTVLLLMFVVLSLLTAAYQNAKQQSGEKALVTNGSVSTFFNKELKNLRLSQYILEFNKNESKTIDEVRLYTAMANEYKLNFPHRYK